MINNKGYSPPQASSALDDVQTAFVDTFPNWNLDPASSNGLIVQEITNMAIEKDQAETLLYGGLYNPDVASDVWLDSIAAFNDIKRNQATSSQVVCVCNGLAGTLIPANSVVLNDNGDEFINYTPLVIGAGGNITGIFYSVAKGEIPCDANTVNSIVQSIAGWDSVNNPTSGTIGQNIETDLSFRYRRRYALAINSAGSVNAIISALANLQGVIAYTVQENHTGTALIIQGVTVNPNTVYVSVYAPDSLDNDIAKILFTKRYCGMQGNFTYNYQDPIYSWVTFAAKWQKPTVTQLQIEVTIPRQPTYPPNIIPLVQQSMVDNFYGNQPPIPAYRMTETVAASRFYFALNMVGVLIATSLTVGIVGGTQGIEVYVPMNQVLELLPDNVIVTMV